MFPPEVRRYGGMTAEFKATSQHIPVELLKKISFRLEGHWAPDSKEENEKIFVAEKATEILPETESEVCKFLMRNCSSLGKTMANHIVERFGMNTLDVCAHHCKQLLDIPRIDDKVIAKLNDACLSALVRADVLKLLQGVDVSPSAINTLVETYGNETIHVLENNPYKPVPILGFAVMDQIALAMGEPVDSERRMTCATIEALHIACQKTGSMCAEESAILARMAALTPQVSAERQKESLDDVAKVYAIVKQGKYYYDKDDFLAERKMSAKIVELASAEPIKEREIEDAFIKWQKENAIILSPRQAEAVRNLKYRISIVTGGPGTGKTTCLRAIMDVYHMVWPEEHILLMAPTGLAAKRMAESTGMNSSTIHKACGLVPANNPSGCVILNGSLVPGMHFSINSDGRLCVSVRALAEAYDSNTQYAEDAGLLYVPITYGHWEYVPSARALTKASEYFEIHGDRKTFKYTSRNTSDAWTDTMTLAQDNTFTMPIEDVSRIFGWEFWYNDNILKVVTDSLDDTNPNNFILQEVDTTVTEGEVEDLDTSDSEEETENTDSEVDNQ